jgi:hypothetical protein
MEFPAIKALRQQLIDARPYYTAPGYHQLAGTFNAQIEVLAETASPQDLAKLPRGIYPTDIVAESSSPEEFDIHFDTYLILCETPNTNSYSFHDLLSEKRITSRMTPLHALKVVQAACISGKYLVPFVIWLGRTSYRPQLADKSAIFEFLAKAPMVCANHRYAAECYWQFYCLIKNTDYADAEAAKAQLVELRSMLARKGSCDLSDQYDPDQENEFAPSQTAKKYNRVFTDSRALYIFDTILLDQYEDFHYLDGGESSMSGAKRTVEESEERTVRGRI